MANSIETPDISPMLRERESELLKIVEALAGIQSLREWHVLETYVFQGVVETLEKRINIEAKKAEINDPELYRLQGQLVWARKYADLNGLLSIFREELVQIRKKLNNKNG